MNEYDRTGDEIWYEVIVVDPIRDLENEVIMYIVQHHNICINSLSLNHT